MTETVWIVNSPRDNEVYHTDKDCTHLIDTKRPVDKTALTDDWSICQYCSGEFQPPANGRSDAYRALCEMDPQDV